MTQIIDFYFDVGSPASYLAWTQLPALALCEDPSVKAELKRLTEEAVRRGIFGAPTFFVGDEMFFGQDRMPQLENYLSVSRGAEI
ncbi:DsbA family protein [Marinobacter sp. MA]